MKRWYVWMMVGIAGCAVSDPDQDVNVLATGVDTPVSLDDDQFGYSAREILDTVGTVLYDSAAPVLDSEAAPDGGSLLSAGAPFTVGPLDAAQAFVRSFTNQVTGEVDRAYLHIEGNLPIRSADGTFDIVSAASLDATGPDTANIAWSSDRIDGSGSVPVWVTDARDVVWSQDSCSVNRPDLGPEDGVTTIVLTGPVDAPEAALYAAWTAEQCFAALVIALVDLGDATLAAPKE